MGVLEVPHRDCISSLGPCGLEMDTGESQPEVYFGPGFGGTSVESSGQSLDPGLAVEQETPPGHRYLRPKGRG